MNNEMLERINSFINDNKIYRCYQLKEWRGEKGIRSLALIRDNYECQDCKEAGKYSKAEEVHHIVELKKSPRLFLTLSNVVSLCKECHNKRHQRHHAGSLKKKKTFTTEERW